MQWLGSVNGFWAERFVQNTILERKWESSNQQAEPARLQPTSGHTYGAFQNFPFSNHWIPQSTMKETREGVETEKDNGEGKQKGECVQHYRLENTPTPRYHKCVLLMLKSMILWLISWIIQTCFITVTQNAYHSTSGELFLNILQLTTLFGRNHHITMCCSFSQACDCTRLNA